MRELVIGLDLGTTGVKALLFDTKGNVVCEAEELVTTTHPKLGWAEQDPDKVDHFARKVLKNIIARTNTEEDKLLAIGISCAMHSLICVDKNNQALSKMLIWSDSRSREQADNLLKAGGNEIYIATGTPIYPMTPLCKLLWMKETDYKPYKSATYFMTMKDYLLSKWYGRRLIDYGMASSTGLLNLKELDWDQNILKLCGITKDHLSSIVSPTETLTNMKEEIAAELGISPNLPLVVGSSDGQLANLGSGAIAPGEVNVSVGTSGAIRQFTKGFPVTESMETFTYAFNTDLSIIGGPTNNGGIALQWAKDLFEFKGSTEEFLEGAGKVGLGAEGLLFHPYINGERAPLWKANARGNLFGFGMEHKKEHVARAVLEGIAFNIYQIGLSLEKLTKKAKKITVNGGLSRSRLWVQIMADIFGQEISVSETHNNAAWGAAWTALVGIGYTEFEAIKENLPKEIIYKPNAKNHRLYQEIYRKYENLGKDLVKYFE